MRLLLDTQVALWAIADDARLTAAARALVADPSSTVVVSAVSIWQIAIHRSLARSDMPLSADEALRYFRLAGYLMLDVTPAHAAGVELLPPIHADPFDRLLVSQALAEPLRLMTHDTTVARYSDSIMLI